MIKNKLTVLIIIFSSILLYSCQSAKEALQGKKRSEQGDEFLVQKKNPLAMPPDYEKLPSPGSKEVLPKTFSENKEVKELLNISEDNNIDSNNDTSPGDLESSIIKKIE
tara:strand:- start:156 stop:482 length:327 start_codon:yes stop_codon:yes gene_type:complete